ncbi:hypothetical protein J3D56_003657 [Erwinia persicina]|jgi:hypothetical protein|uniref:Uncharacterized protein n=2 Tax=Erwinia TaxID=551 RepID=A0ABV4E8J4_9GAMM|nr:MULTISPECIES: hypothetical protein [Erwinia]MCP1440221.1 hypothetical protein [Erwinia persicina]MDN4629701.1 hypothetical protein [Erwinia sp. PsM31]
MIKKLLFVFLPVALFLVVSTGVLSLSFMDIKYTYEPALIGSHLDYLVGETYSIAWLFYGVLNVAFIIIYVISFFIFNRLSKKHRSLSSQ